jgi:hypothetical protein
MNPLTHFIKIDKYSLNDAGLSDINKVLHQKTKLVKCMKCGRLHDSTEGYLCYEECNKDIANDPYGTKALPRK